MGIGPAPATRKVLALTGLTLAQIDVIELNEAFAAQGLAVLRDLGLADDDPRVNPNGGAIALGHPLGASGARLVTTAVNQLQRSGGRYALCTMCIGVGQGIALILERSDAPPAPAVRILFIGGGVFLGRALLDAALERGHAPSVLNRGRARQDWPDGVEVFRGDRRGDLGVLAGGRWDAVIDTCGYCPADVLPTAQALQACRATCSSRACRRMRRMPAAA